MQHIKDSEIGQIKNNLKSRFPTRAQIEKYEKGEMISDENKYESAPDASFQQQTIASIVSMVYNLMTSSGTIKNNIIAMYKLVRTLALRFKEWEYLRDLKKLYDSVEVTSTIKKKGNVYKISRNKESLPLPIVQYIVSRDGDTKIGGFSPFKSYEQGKYTLMDLIMALDAAELQILDIFTLMCISHDIDTSFTPQMMKPDLGDVGGDSI